MRDKRKIIIYGAGSYGRKAYEYYCDQYEIVCFMDSDTKKSNFLVNGLPVFPPSSLKTISYDKIFIASSFADEIYRSLISEFGVTEENIHIIPISELHRQDHYVDLQDRFFKLISLLDSEEIPYWLDHSSLLGLIRDNDPCKIDVDLAVMAEGAERLKDLLVGHYPADELSVMTYGFDFDLWHSGDIKQFKIHGALDIHVKVPSPDGVFWLVGPMLLKVGNSFYCDHDPLSWAGMYFRGPKKCRQYLKALYGNWETSPASWNYSDYNNIAHVFELDHMQGV